ncbi:Hypothetical predicted protein [Octopus vulgaris]|uniref:Uncharacterized protein n=1 Tax=Octopus vulgaris TaxID=6645 RepID=A0AA36AQP1_OCTVU|nr:Hypothetical predicted protein [Octopus vulgaris]
MVEDLCVTFMARGELSVELRTTLSTIPVPFKATGSVQDVSSLRRPKKYHTERLAVHAPILRTPNSNSAEVISGSMKYRSSTGD